MNTDLDEPRGWCEVHDGEDYPVYRTQVPRRGGDGLLCGYLRVMDRSTQYVDVIVEEREQEHVEAGWLPMLSGVIDISVQAEETQEWIDTAADAWLSWAQSRHLPGEPPG